MVMEHCISCFLDIFQTKLQSTFSLFKLVFNICLFLHSVLIWLGHPSIVGLRLRLVILDAHIEDRLLSRCSLVLAPAGRHPRIGGDL